MAATLRTRAPLATRASATPRGLPALRLARVSRPLGLQVLASSSSVNPVPPEPSPKPPAGASIPTPPVYLRSDLGGSTPPGGAGGFGGGSLGGGGAGGGVRKTVGTGGPGGGLPTPPPINWRNVILVALAAAFAVPLWNWFNRRYLLKPEPEHTLAVAEDKVADIKSKGGVSKVMSNIKHATVDPVRDAVSGTKHSDPIRTVQHKVEDVKDNVDVGVHTGGKTVERAGSHAKKEVKQVAENTKVKLDDTGAVIDSKAHEQKVKGGRSLQRVGEQIEDTVHRAEENTAKAGKSVLESLKGAATTVGRKLHLVADATEKGTRKVVNKSERTLGVAGVQTTESERRAMYYTAGGVTVGATILSALYFYDKKGGDLGGKMRKLRNQTKDAANDAVEKAKGAFTRTTGEPAGPKAGGPY